MRPPYTDYLTKIIESPIAAEPRQGEWTIYDVAKVAGVSTNTVSKVLNKKPGVGIATRKRVEKIIKDVGFSPHIGARGLRAKQNACIGVAMPVPFEASPASQSFLLWLFTLLYKVFSGPGEYVCFDLATLAPQVSVDYARGLFAQLFKAFLLIGPLAVDDSRIRLIHNAGHPYLALGRLDAFPECSSATVDYVEGAYQSTRFLLERGHTRIAMLKAFEGYQPGVERLRGYEKALNEAGVSMDPALIQNIQFGPKNVTVAVEALLQDRSITALIDASATEDGVSIREGLKLAGRDPEKNLEVVSWTYNKGVSVLHEEVAHLWLPVRESAEEGVSRLADWIYGRSEGPIKVLHQPVLEESVGEKEIEPPTRLFESLD
ncbi:MAG: LacI family DNA-binding transcriptional regulator [Candidatus Hydrogenedentales bacterium]